MDSSDSGKKRGRTTEKDAETTSQEVSPPTKRHTRSLSRGLLMKSQQKRAASTPGNQDAAKNLEEEIVFLGEEMANDTAEAAEKKSMLAAAKIKTLPDMAMFVVEQLKGLPTQKALDDAVEMMRERTDRIGRTAEENTSIIQRLDSRLQRVESGMVMERPSHSTTHPTREEDFDKASRTIKFWPITGGNNHEMSNNLDDFLKNGLLISEEDQRTIIIDDIIRVRDQNNTMKYL